MYGDLNHVRWQHESCWTRCVYDFLARIFKTRLDAAHVSFPIVKAMAWGYGGSTRAPNMNLTAVRLALTNTIVENNMFGGSAGIIDELINFQGRYLREQPGDPIRTEYMTVAELNNWRVNMCERIAVLMIA